LLGSATVPVASSRRPADWPYHDTAYHFVRVFIKGRLRRGTDGGGRDARAPQDKLNRSV